MAWCGTSGGFRTPLSIRQDTRASTQSVPALTRPVSHSIRLRFLRVAGVDSLCRPARRHAPVYTVTTRVRDGSEGYLTCTQYGQRECTV